VGRAESLQGQLYQRMREFMAAYEFLILPVSQVPPFDVSERWVKSIEGLRMETYIDWMKSCCFVSVTGNPAISVPCGFTPEGLPVGVQIVGRHRDDLGVLQLAFAFEQATQFWRRRPPLLSAEK
jgi:amidase